MPEKKLYNEASAYIEYLESESVPVTPELSEAGDLDMVSLDSLDSIDRRARCGNFLGKLALGLEFRFARFKLRQAAHELSLDDSEDGLLQLAARIKYQEEESRYGGIPIIGSTEKAARARAQEQKTMADIEKGLHAEDCGLIIKRILSEAETSGLRSQCAAQVRKSY